MTEEKSSSVVDMAIEAKIKKPKLTPVYNLLEGAIKVWWKNLIKFLKVYLWGILFTLIPVAIAGLLFGLLAIIDSSTSINVSARFFILIISTMLFMCFLVAMYFIVRAYIGIFLVVKNNYEGNELKIFKDTKKYFWSYLWLTILTGILILLWALLLIIPGIIFSIFYSFAVYAFFFEGLTGMKAIRRSISLVKNYWWAVFGRFIVIGIALYIFTMIISIPLHLVSDKSIFFYIWTTIIQIISFLIGPISLLYFYQIYQDLVKIKK